MALGEFALIESLFRRPQDARRGRVAVGGGDDCAVLTVQAGEQWAVSTDTLVEGRHFLSTVDPEALGHKALAVNLSDLAACGAQPQACTLNLTLPRTDPAWLQGFARGFHALADEHGIVLAGGDTTGGPLSITVTVMGTVPAGAALLRSGAKAGDDLWVSHPTDGGIGDARLALEVFRGRARLCQAGFEAARQRMERPQPRVALGLALRGLAHAAIDLSDGLTGDLAHVLAASGVGAQLWWSALPRSRWMAEQPAEGQREALLGGGDDYELLVAAPAAERQTVVDRAAACGLGLSRIGRIVAGAGLKVFEDEAAGHAGTGAWPSERLPRGFDHFLSGSTDP
ncbi:MAG: thiamine monophosphate kinase [Pseudomonadota bacterium]